MLEEKRSSKSELWGRVLVPPPQRIYIAVSLSSSVGSQAPTPVEGNHFRLSTRALKHQPVTSSPTRQKKVCTQWKMTLCPPPQIIVLLLCFFIQLCWTLCNPTDCNLPGSSVHEDSPGKSELPCSPPGDIPKRHVEPRCPALQADSLQSEPPEKPKSPGVGSLSLLQGNLKPRNQTGVSCCRRNLSAFPFLPLKTLMGTAESSELVHGHESSFSPGGWPPEEREVSFPTNTYLSSIHFWAETGEPEFGNINTYEVEYKLNTSEHPGLVEGKKS